MRKLSFPIILIYILLANVRLQAQYSVGISTNPNTTELNCANNSVITLAADLIVKGARVVAEPVAITYKWSKNVIALSETGRTLTVVEPGIYDVEVTITIEGVSSDPFKGSIVITENKTSPVVTAQAFPSKICKGDTSALVALGALTYVWKSDAITSNPLPALPGIVVKPDTRTTYTVTGTGINGCTATAIVPVVVNTLPTSSISNDANVCQNAAPSPVIFTGSNGTKPFTFYYNVNGGRTETGFTTGTNDTAVIGAPTIKSGKFTYQLISVVDSNGCRQSQSEMATISVLPRTSLMSSKIITLCNDGLFHYQAESIDAGTVFSWNSPAVEGITSHLNSGLTSLVDETLHNETTEPIVVTYFFTLSTGLGCETTDSVKVTVNPTLVANPIRDTTFCNGAIVNGGIPFTSSFPGSSFNWKSDNVNVGLPTDGKGTIPRFTASNDTNFPVTATVTVYIEGPADNKCPNLSTTFKITVLPASFLTSVKDTIICDESSFVYAATSSNPNTKLTWARPEVAGIKNAAGFGTSSTITEILDNTTSLPIVVRYIFTLLNGTGCVTTDVVNVTVYPTPVIIPINDTTFCNGFSLRDGIVFRSSVPGATFKWTNNNTAIGLQESANGSIPPFTANNATKGPLTATIKVSLLPANGCKGSDTTFRIIVAAASAPILKNDTIKSICDNDYVKYTAISSEDGTAFMWTRPVVAGINLKAGSGTTADVHEALDNTTALPVAVTYFFKLSGSGCETTTPVVVTVNPTPAVNGINDMTFCNGNAVSGGIPFSSSSPDVSFAWTNDDTTIGLPKSGNGNILPFTATNNKLDKISSAITVLARGNTSGCLGPSSAFDITVNPAPVLTSVRDTSICNNLIFTYTAVSSLKGTTVQWERLAVGNMLEEGIRTSSRINETLQNTSSNPIVVMYVFTLENLFNKLTPSCITSDTLKVTVYPTPKIELIKDITFCNGFFVEGGVPFGRSPFNASLNWTNSDTTIGLLLRRGTNNIPPFNAINTTDTAKSTTIGLSIRIGDKGCAGKDTSFKITVMPAPLFLSTKDTSVCNKTLFNYEAKSSDTGTMFNWTRAKVVGITPDIQSKLSSTISETLTNSSLNPLVVKYTFLLTKVGCNTTDSVKVVVNPTPQLDLISAKEFCNDSLIQPIIFNSTPKTASLSWVSNTTIGFGSGGSGDRIPAFITYNPGDTSIDATVKVNTLIGGTCLGDSTQFVIKVYPTPALTSAKTTSVCDNKLLNYVATSSAKGTSYSWVRIPVDSIDGGDVSGKSDTIRQTLHNLTRRAIDVYYDISLKVSDGCGIMERIKVTVNPTPKIDSIFDYKFCNGDYVPEGTIKFKSDPDNTSFSWNIDTSNGVKSVGFGSRGVNSLPTFTATNAGTSPLVALITVTDTASSDKCGATTRTFKITVNPSPPKPAFTSMSSYPDNVTLKLCKGAQNINFNVNGPLPGITYRWRKTPNNSTVNIRDTTRANTVISFPDLGPATIDLVAIDPLGNCSTTTSQIVEINDAKAIEKRSIAKMQPGNLLIYPDNSFTGYQWGYDSVTSSPTDTTYGPPTAVPGQVYQFFIPGAKFLNGNGTLNEQGYAYWVLLRKDSCYTKVYYNGRYSRNRVMAGLPADTTVELQIIPNPNKGSFEIALKGNIYGKINAQIYNAIGQVVFRKNFVKVTPDIKERLSADNLPAGLYFLILYSSDFKKVVSRFVIQR